MRANCEKDFLLKDSVCPLIENMQSAKKQTPKNTGSSAKNPEHVINSLVFIQILSGTNRHYSADPRIGSGARSEEIMFNENLKKY